MHHKRRYEEVQYIILDLGPNPPDTISIVLREDNSGEPESFDSKREATTYAESACSWDYKIVEV